jgi:outer membrane lipoprotein-sorting protein
MRRLLCGAFTVAAALVFFAAAIDAQSVDEIIARNLSAKGGVELLKNTTTVRTTGTGMMQGAKVRVVSSSKRPNLVRNEMTMAGETAAQSGAGQPGAAQAMAGQTIVQGFDGQTLWLSAGGMPAQPLPPGPQTQAMKQGSQIDSPLLDYKAKGTKIELGEPLAEAGRKFHHLVVTPKDAPTMHYYIDPVSNLENRMVVVIEDGGQNMEMRFSNYKELEGRTVPMTVTQFVNGKQVMQFNYEKIEFNVPMDDALFRMPE